MDPSLNGPPRESPAPLDVRRLLREAGLRPRKSLGQNFLVHEGALRRVAAAADIQPDDLILEIGAGVGSLTRHLAARARRVVAVEIDPHLIPILRAVLAPFPNAFIVQGDILALPPERILGKTDPAGFTVAANIPYYITSAVIRHLMEGPARPRRLVLTVQKEVAERICAGPGKMSLLALSVQYYGRPSIEGKIPADSFYPVPEVDSAIVRVDLEGSPDRAADAADRLFRIARAGFSQKRKKLRNALSAGLKLPAGRVEGILSDAGVDSSRRPETLTVAEWRRLAEKFPSGIPDD
ncbi:MAG: 16S rRNA (adenine(1518)-N(6)/adenine(1519)-N(6))-dimethyltransferase RsmA [Anaerolineales bacterium]